MRLIVGYIRPLFLVLFIMAYSPVLYAANSVITMYGSGAPATSPHITISSGADFCPDEIAYVSTGATVSGSVCGSTLVEFIEFKASGFVDYILLEWETASEIDNAGFHLWRSQTEDGGYTRITAALIPAKGGPTAGATYIYEDTDLTPPQVWYYKIESIDNSGVSTFHGPVLGVVGNAAATSVDGTGSIPDGETAPGIGDIAIQGSGQHTVTTGRYPDNPAGAPTFTPTGDYWFVDVTDLSGLNSITVRFCPAQSGNRVYYWNGGDWNKCSQQEYTDGCIAVTITSSTSPQISDLSMLVFALGRGSSTAIPTLSEWGMILLSLLIVPAAIVAMRRRRLGLNIEY